MGSSKFIDTGLVSGSDIIHFAQAAANINARVAGPMLLEPLKGHWGTSPKEFQRKVAEQLAQTAEGFECMQMLPDGKSAPFKMDGHPEIFAAAENDTLRLLVSVDSRGCRRVACAILQKGRGSASGRASMGAAKRPSIGWLEVVAVVVCTLIGGWLLSRPEIAALSSGAKVGVTAVTALVLAVVMTWVQMRRSRQ